MQSKTTAFALLLFAFLNLASGADLPLVNHGDSWRYRKGTNAPQSNWKTATDASLDSTWLTGNGGIGYADNPTETQFVQTTLGDMRNFYTTVYMRRTFQIASSVDPTSHLKLTMDWDDGFIAWLDGNMLTNAFSPGAPAEPAFNAVATALHESSNGDGTKQLPVTYDLGVVGSRLAIGPHVLAIIGLNQNSTSSDLIMIPDLSVGVACSSISITANTTWRAVDSPIVVCGGATVSGGATLTIEPGTTVQLGSGADITVANGGILLANGTSNAPIHFTRSGTSGNWGQIIVNGGVGSPESQIAYATFDFNVNNGNDPAILVNGGTVLLDHLTFRTTGSPYVHVDNASFVIRDCFFPPASTAFEPCHGTGGIKSGGRGIFLRNFFGKAIGYSDVVDFTSGNRDKGQPIVQFINNVVAGSDDDGFDLDGTDAWVEGNIFLHMHKNGATPDSSSAVSGGKNGSDLSQVSILRNIIFDCDQAADAKETNFYTLYYNTIVHQNHSAGIDTDAAVIALADAGTAQGLGAYFEGNILQDIEKFTRNVTTAVVTFTNNIVPIPWTGLGGDNVIADPLFKHLPLVSETFFTNWAEAQVMWDWFSLLPNSPAIGAGPNGEDQGAVALRGVNVSGAPTGTTAQTSATLIVGINRNGGAIPSAGFPLGSGYTHYKWRLDSGAWSAETPIATPITLSGLADGSHQVGVVGKNDAGMYQDDPILGPDAVVTTKTWTVQTQVPLRITSYSKTGNTFTLHFTAQAGQTYTVQSKLHLEDATWSKVQDVPAQGSTRDISVADNSALGTTKFYRIVSPAQ